jgi:pectinesterase
VPAGQQQQVLDLRQLPAGVYILRATTDGGTDTRRIVKQ